MKFYFKTPIFRNSAWLALAVAMSCGSSERTQAQTNLDSVASREIVRRQENVVMAETLISKGDRAMSSKDYEAAYVSYLDAVDATPAGSATDRQRVIVVGKFSQAGIAYAEFLISSGRYGDAERVAKTILLPQYNPSYKPAVQLLSNLEQPNYYQKTTTPEFTANREEVMKLLNEGQGYFQAGRFDLAMSRYEQVLNIDPYNSAARKGMEQVNGAKSQYYNNAYNETRARMLWLVDRAWERPVRRFVSERSTSANAGLKNGGRDTAAITAKLNRIIIPKIDLRETSVREAIEFLKQRSRDLDSTAASPQDKRGVNIVLKLASPVPVQVVPADPNAAPVTTDVAAPQGGNADTKVTLNLSNVPLIEALRYLTDLAGLKYKVEPYAVSIVPLTENTTDLLTKEYRVPPGFIPSGQPSEEAMPSAGAAITATPTGSRLSGKVNALDYLKSQGIDFPAGAFAQYVPAGSRLIVRTTPDAIDTIDYLVDAAYGVQPTQVEIESKFLEITQNNLSELGFDWLLGPLAIGGSGVYGAGGTQGFNNGVNSANYPFAPGGSAIGANPVTGGLRSGFGNGANSAISVNGLDALLGAGSPIGAAPAIFGVAGIFSNPQFQVVIRALNQKKGVDLMSAPKVTTKSGKKAIVRVVREFPYPTEFSPPEPPPAQTGGSSSSTTPLPAGSITSQGVVTPSTPTAFERRNLGVTLEVDPVIGPDGYTIDLNLSPEVVEFEGFINYGTPILGPIFDIATFSISSTTLTENVINQPIFSTRKVTTSVSIWDGQTVSLGGLIREDVQKVQDKVPFLGDIPLAGRLFRSNVDQKIKRNLIIFVTARLMDAEGRPIRQDEDQEEIVETLGLPQELPPPSFDLGKGGSFK